MFPWAPRIRVVLFSLAFACVACGGSDEADPAASPTEAVDPAANSETSQAEEELADELDDEAPLEVDVDDMDEHALEAACFAGQQAACDQLGH